MAEPISMRLGADFRVADVVREGAARRGDVTAVRDSRHDRLAQALLAAGAGPGARVAYVDRTATEVVELLFAASKIGAVLVPLNWRLAPRELAVILTDARPLLLIAGATFAALAQELADQLSPAPALIVVDSGRRRGYETWLAAHAPVDPGGRGQAGDAVVQMYTSGTTRVPKGVLTTHRNLAAAAETSPRWGFDETSISLTPLPMFHIGGIGWTFVGLWNGATTILVSGGENVYPVEVEEALSQHPGVADVAVIGVPDERWGEAVKALVVRRPGSTPTAAELIAFTRERLAGYKQPRSIEFVAEFPRTPSGKVRKRELRARHRS